MWWIWLIVGALMWQAITTTAFILSDENKDTTILAGGGAALLMVRGISKFIRKLVRVYYGLAYSAFTIYMDIYGIPYSNRNIRIKRKNISMYYQKGENDIYIAPSESHPDSCYDVNKICEEAWFTQEWVDTNLKKVQ